MIPISFKKVSPTYSFLLISRLMPPETGTRLGHVGRPTPAGGKKEHVCIHGADTTGPTGNGVFSPYFLIPRRSNPNPVIRQGAGQGRASHGGRPSPNSAGLGDFCIYNVLPTFAVTERGKKQRAPAERSLAKGYRDLVYPSPLVRSGQTRERLRRARRAKETRCTDFWFFSVFSHSSAHVFTLTSQSLDRHQRIRWLIVVVDVCWA